MTGSGKAREAHPRQPREEASGEYARRLEKSMPQSEAGVKKPGIANHHYSPSPGTAQSYEGLKPPRRKGAARLAIAEFLRFSGAQDCANAHFYCVESAPPDWRSLYSCSFLGAQNCATARFMARFCALRLGALKQPLSRARSVARDLPWSATRRSAASRRPPR